MRSLKLSSRLPMESKIELPLSLMRSISASPELLMVIVSLVEAPRMLSRMTSLAELSWSFSVSLAPVIEARTRSAWVTTASRSLPSPSTNARMRAWFSV